MRCIQVHKYRGKAYPCTHPAIVVYQVDGAPYAFCAAHHTRERQAYADRYSVPRRVLVTA